MTGQTNNLVEQLLPCPAGHTGGRVIGGPGTAGGPKYWAGCDECNWRAWGDTQAEAIAAWNTRDQSLSARIAVLGDENERLKAQLVLLAGIEEAPAPRPKPNGPVEYGDVGKLTTAIVCDDCGWRGSETTWRTKCKGFPCELKLAALRARTQNTPDSQGDG